MKRSGVSTNIVYKPMNDSDLKSAGMLYDSGVRTYIIAKRLGVNYATLIYNLKKTGRVGIGWSKRRGTCFRCDVKLTPDNRDMSFTGSYICKSCGRLKRGEKSRSVREKVLIHYGAKCSCSGCNETRLEFLTMDHSNNDGAKLDRIMGKRLSGYNLYRWIIQNNYPEEFRIMCWNCNCARGAHGYCPHEKEIIVKYAETQLALKL